MPTIKDILATKGAEVVCIHGDATVLQAALLMNKHKIGALVVTDKGQVAGMFTERDVLHRVVAAQRDPTDTKVRDVMTREVICCGLETSIDEAKGVFKNRRIRHLPVVDAGASLLGLISIGDLNAFQSDTQELTIHYLHEYLYGRT